MPFSSLIGNPQVKTQLLRMVAKQQLPPVLLFCGPDGVGKTLFALKLADLLLGNRKQFHPDLHRIQLENNTHPIATIRQMVSEARLPPFEAACQVFIIEQADRMQLPSSQALLKTLEEPPPATYFILISSDPDQLPDTILSRCRKVPFFPIPEPQIVDFLVKQGKTAQEAKTIALRADGSLAKAVSPSEILFEGDPSTWLSQLEEDADPDLVFEQLLYWVRSHNPLKLETVLPLILEGRRAIEHNIKLSHVLEKIFRPLA